jgi:hypothetical protein
MRKLRCRDINIRPLKTKVAYVPAEANATFLAISVRICSDRIHALLALRPVFGIFRRIASRHNNLFRALTCLNLEDI